MRTRTGPPDPDPDDRASPGSSRPSLLCLPFGLSVIEFAASRRSSSSGLLEQVASTAGGYPYLTVNAYNPWALVPGDTGNSLANAGLWVCDFAGDAPSSAAPGSAVFGGIPAVADRDRPPAGVDRR